MGSLISKFVFHPPSHNDNFEVESFESVVKGEKKIFYYKWYPFLDKNVNEDGDDESVLIPTILYCHDMKDDICTIDETIKSLVNKIKCNILVFEYPGYGKTRVETQFYDFSSKIPSESSCYDATRAALNFLSDVKGVPTSSTIVWGDGYGSGPAIQICCEETLRGLVLGYPIISVCKSQIPLLPFNLRSLGECNIFDNENKISNLKTQKVLIIYEENDQIQKANSIELLKARKNNTWMVTSQSKIKDFSEENINILQRFFEFCFILKIE